MNDGVGLATPEPAIAGHRLGLRNGRNPWGLFGKSPRPPRWARPGLAIRPALARAAAQAARARPTATVQRNPVPGMPAGDAGGGAAPDDPAADALDCSEPMLGATPLQRLGRAQYVNAVRDTLQVTVDARQVPEDERFGVFDGNTAVALTNLVLEQYIDVAERAARLALPSSKPSWPAIARSWAIPPCATQFITSFGLRAYRRPLESDEVARYQALFSASQAQGYANGTAGDRADHAASPNFLYRVELIPAGAGDGTLQPLAPFELATRLSFFLLSTTPDNQLLEAAQSGALASADGLSSEVDRLLADPRFSDTLVVLPRGGSAEELDGLDSVSRDPALFPAFTPALGTAMRAETLRFVDYVMREDDATFTTLLTAPYSFRRKAHCSTSTVSIQAPRSPVSPLHSTRQRAGVLTQPAFLTAHSHYDQASPVQRGKEFVIRNLLCQTLPDPPPGVNPTPSAPSSDATTRERLLVHQDDASCAGCHRRIDGIGFGFEHYDAIGAFRTRDSVQGKAVDASGEILGDRSSDSPFDGAVSSPSSSPTAATRNAV